MDSHNLATIFAPNLLHKAKGMGEFEVEQAERAEESADVIAVVQEMIDSCDELFQISAALHDEVLRKLSILNSDALDYLLNIIVATNRTGYAKICCLRSKCLKHSAYSKAGQLTVKFITIFCYNHCPCFAGLMLTNRDPSQAVTHH